jgi:short-subunit dehydrogenase
MKNQLAIITGGSSGLGLELARVAADTITVCIISRDEKKLKNAIDSISKDNVFYHIADVSQEQDVKDLYNKLQNYELKHVVNCAGAGLFGRPEDISSDMVNTLIDSNLKSVIYMSANALPVMQEKGGTITSILSTAAIKGNPLESIYCATKWGARGYCEALKTAYKGTNIRIQTICPGGINTPFWTSECGLQPDINKFMDPKELAGFIWEVIQEKKTFFCQDIIVEKI